MGPHSEKILEAGTAIDKHVHALLCGLHWVKMSDGPKSGCGEHPPKRREDEEPAGKLGSEIAGLFQKLGLKTDIHELRGHQD